MAAIAEKYLSTLLTIGPLDWTVAQRNRLEKWLKASKRRQKKSIKLFEKRKEHLLDRNENDDDDGKYSKANAVPQNVAGNYR